MKILLLSAYDAYSHRYWHQQLINQFPQHEWQVLTLKDRHFAWRMAGNALAFKSQYHCELQANYDLIIATSMTDLSTLLGLYPHLALLPKQLYFHENQFAYPTNNKQQGLLEIQMRHIYSAMAADRMWFNSKYNLNTFLSGVKTFTQKMPDGIPKELMTDLSAKCYVLPVPIADDCLPDKPKKANKKGIEVAWNHRWEHDKGPETLLQLMRLCVDQQNIKFHIMGQQFRSIPPAMQQIIGQHQHQCLTLGHVESRQQYIATLQQADVVLSTATHDFQGLAMLEAAACGCLPIAPDRLVYPGLYPSSNLYPSTPQDQHQEAQAIHHLLSEPKQLKAVTISCHWQHLRPQYEQLFS